MGPTDDDTALSWAMRNVLFHDEGEREAAARVLGRHAKEAVAAIAARLPETNVYLSGSLARGEPALRNRSGGGIGLQSDLDFVLVGEVEPERLREAERALAATFLGFRDTLYAFRPEQLAGLRSASARDLALGLCHPLRTVAPVPAPEPFTLEPGHALEVLVYQLVAALAHRLEPAARGRREPGGIWQVDRAYGLHKLAVEALRVATVSLDLPGERALSFRAVFEHRLDPRLQAVAPEAEIVELLRGRERWRGGGVAWSQRLALLVHGAIGAVVGRPGAAPGAVLEEVAGRFYDLGRPIHAYGAAAVAAFYAESPCLREEGVAAIAADLRGCLEEAWPGAAASGAQSLAGAVVAARWDYVRRLVELKDSGTPLWSPGVADAA